VAKLLQIANEAPPIRHTAQELKQMFLEKAQPLVEQYIEAALGTGKLQSTNAEAREEVWDVLKKLMLQSSDKLDISIESAQDVLDAVSSGKCTFEEADKLLGLFEKMRKIETTGLLGSSSTGGVTVNILATPQATEIKEVITHEEA